MAQHVYESFRDVFEDLREEVFLLHKYYLERRTKLTKWVTTHPSQFDRGVIAEMTNCIDSLHKLLEDFDADPTVKGDHTRKDLRDEKA